MPAQDTAPLRQALGERLKSIRQNAGLTLQAAADRIGLAPSTLSKIENGLTSPTYEKIVLIADGYRVEIEALFGQKSNSMATARFAVTRRDEGKRLSTDAYDYEMLCTSISKKRIIPIVTTVKRESFSPSDYSHHSGEEMVYVLSGQVDIHLEYYESISLEVGDCVYFDSNMGHAIVSTGNDPARILWACTQTDIEKASSE